MPASSSKIPGSIPGFEKFIVKPPQDFSLPITQNYILGLGLGVSLGLGLG